MPAPSPRLLCLAAFAAALPAQDWPTRIAAQWPGASVAKATEAEFLSFAKQQDGLDAKAGWAAFVAAQHQALGLPLPRDAAATRAAAPAEGPGGSDGLLAEAEPNDLPAQAQPIQGGDHVEAALGAGDRDWFVFTVPAATALSLYTSPGPGGAVTDTVLELYDDQQTLIAVNDDSRGLFSTLVGTVGAGTYRVRVRHFAAAGTGAYALDLSLAVATPTVAEAPEPNAAPATATAFDAGRTGEGRVVVAGDQDWWTFTLTQPLTIVAETAGAAIGPTLQDSTLTLWDAAGTTQLAFDDDAGPGLFARLVLPLPAGTYHLAVGGYLTSTGRYTLRLDATLGQQATIAEAAEPNGTAATATQFGPAFLGRGAIQAPLDSDFWLVTLTQNTRLAIRTAPGAAGTPLDDPTLGLRRLDGTLLAFDDDGGPGLQAQLFVEVAQGSYLIDVRGYQNLTGSYELDVVGTAGQNAARASYTLLGGGCVGSNNLVPRWTVRPLEVPLLGTTLVGEFRDLPGFGAIGFLGLSNQITATGVPLPVSLAPFGAPGCSVDVDPLVTFVLFADPNGVAPWAVAVPFSPAFLSIDIFQQGLVLDAAANPLGITTSNAGRGVIGERL